MDTNISKGVAVDIEMGVTKATSDGSRFANWIVDVEARAGNTNKESQEELLWKKASIYKVPAYKRELNSRAFTPMLVSFGPFHNDNPELKKMEVHKERALVHFLKRTNQSLQNIKQEVAKIIVELRDAYCCLGDRWKTNDEEFLKMMILDGCFTLEILQMLELLLKPEVLPFIDKRGYSDIDPYFSPHAVNHKWSYIRRDMLLIENQLPLLLLKTLVHFQTSNPDEQDDYINGLVLNLVAENCNTSTNTRLGLHPLDLFRRSLLSPEPKVQPTQSEPLQNQSDQVGPEPKLQHTQSEPPENQYEQVDIIRCAIELHEAGVRFKKSETNNLKNIRFDSITGKFHLPFLKVDDATECSLLNVIAFEYLHANLAPDVTTYVTVMDEIIDSANDVRLLHDKGLILSTLGSDEEVARIFNSMGKEITMPHDDNLSEVRKNVSQYCRKRRHRWRAYLISTYFRNPWTIISLAGALLIIVLTIAQTVYASRKN